MYHRVDRVHSFNKGEAMNQRPPKFSLGWDERDRPEQEIIGGNA
jgi:hypothetical protein